MVVASQFPTFGKQWLFTLLVKHYIFMTCFPFFVLSLWFTILNPQWGNQWIFNVVLRWGIHQKPLVSPGKMTHNWDDFHHLIEQCSFFFWGGSSSKCKEKILECAKREWDEWKKTLNDLGYENTPEYPYNMENLGVYCAAEVAEAARKFGPLPPWSPALTSKKWTSLLFFSMDRWLPSGKLT